MTAASTCGSTRSSATSRPASSGRRAPATPTRGVRYWEDPSTRAYYFIGKDNIPFHTIIWPAMLMGQGAYILPYDVPANEFLNLEGRQLSTSRNWAVWVPDYLETVPA